ncbi:MAG TPA: type II toxin-antitoxin system PemK/MazF family toxin [Solirubrobacterales bacterium]
MRTKPELPLDPPKRGELYFADLDPVAGHEQGGRRPFLVLSILAMNRSPLDMAIGLPVTTNPRDRALRIRIEPSQSGLSRVSYAMPEMIRSISTERFGGLLGRVPSETLESAAARAGFLLGLGRTKF